MGGTALQAKINWTLVPYPGEAPALAALLGGHVTAALATSGAWARFVEAGSLRLIGSMDDERFDAAPNASTMVELGYPPNMLIFYLAGPKGLPPVVIKRLTDAFTEAMNSPRYIEFVAKNAMGLRKPLEGAELQRYLMAERASMGEIAEKLGIRKE